MLRWLAQRREDRLAGKRLREASRSTPILLPRGRFGLSDEEIATVSRQIAEHLKTAAIS